MPAKSHKDDKNRDRSYEPVTDAIKQMKQIYLESTAKKNLSKKPNPAQGSGK